MLFRKIFDLFLMFFFSMFCLSILCLFYIFASLCFVVLCFVIDPLWNVLCEYIVRQANRDWPCQTGGCHTLSNKTSLQ